MILGLVGLVAGVAGSGMANEAAIKAGKQEQAFRRKQATAIRAEASQTAWNERENKERILSRATALAAASGAGVSDPTMVKILGDLEGEGAYREAVAVYQGEAQARLLEEMGDAAKQAGRDKADYYGAQGIASALQGASTLYSQYNTSSPNTSTVTNGTRNGVPAVVPGKTSTYTPRKLGYG
jgi:hypothetical protein